MGVVGFCVLQKGRARKIVTHDSSNFRLSHWFTLVGEHLTKPRIRACGITCDWPCIAQRLCRRRVWPHCQSSAQHLVWLRYTEQSRGTWSKSRYHSAILTRMSR